MRIFLLENPTKPENWKEHENKKSARNSQFSSLILLISLLIAVIFFNVKLKKRLILLNENNLFVNICFSIFGLMNKKRNVLLI